MIWITMIYDLEFVFEFKPTFIFQKRYRSLARHQR